MRQMNAKISKKERKPCAFSCITKTNASIGPYNNVSVYALLLRSCLQ